MDNYEYLPQTSDGEAMDNLPSKCNAETYDDYEVVETSSRGLGGFLNLVTANQQLVDKALDLGKQVVDVYAESQRLNAKVAVVQEMSKIELAKIAAKFKNTQTIIEKTFEERGMALSAQYKALDYAIEKGDSSLIIGAISQISNVVTTSPLQDIQNFAKLYDDTSQPLLDF